MMPNNTIASMTSVVITGRRMKIAAIFMVASYRFPVTGNWAPATGNSQCIFHFHVTLRRQSNLSVGDDSFSRRDAAVDDALLVDRFADFHRPHLHRSILSDNIVILSTLFSLNSLSRNDN